MENIEVKDIVENQIKSNSFTEEQYLQDIDTLVKIYKQHCPYKEKDFNYPEFTPITDIVLPCEQMVRTNLDAFRNGIQFLCKDGTAHYRQKPEDMPKIKSDIEEVGLINFLNQYVDTYINVIYSTFKGSPELTEQLKISIFISAYCASIVDSILCMHQMDSMSALTVMNEAVKLQLNIVDSVCNVRYKEFNVVEAGIRWGLDLTYLQKPE